MPDKIRNHDPEKLRELLLKTTRLTLQGAELLSSTPPTPESKPSPETGPEPHVSSQPPATNHQRTTNNWVRLGHILAPIHWEWPGWLPGGFLTILASQPGTGKSILCLHLAATYLNRLPWPDHTPFTGRDSCVLWCESESSHALNLQRARAWDLDLSRLLSPLNNPLHNFNLDNDRHAAALLDLARHDQVRLVIIDSLRGLRSLGRKTRPIGDLLTALADIARVSGKPLLLTHHLRKRATRDAAGRLTPDQLLGAGAISQTARVIWALDTPDPHQPARRRLSVIKNNLAPYPGPLGFHIQDDGLHFGPPPEPPTHHSEFERAVTFLRDQLAAGPLSFHDIRARARAAGLAVPTLRRAKKHLAVRSIRPAGETTWHWTLPR